MSRTTSVSLGGHFDGLISSLIANGRYGNTSEVIRAGLRLLEADEQKLQALRNALRDGEESGVADFSYDEFVAEMDSETLIVPVVRILHIGS